VIGRNNSSTKVLVCLILALGTALLYAPTLHFDFVNYDDPLYVINNFHIRAFSWESLAWCFQSGYASLWHPLTWMSHMLDFQLFGLRPGWHHATNVVLHIFNSLLLFAVLQRMTKAVWRSAMVAALFAWHPLHVESVAWISERKDVLSALFFLLTIWAYIRYVEEVKIRNLHHGSHGLHGFDSLSAPSDGTIKGSARVARAQSMVKTDSSVPFYVLALFFFALGLMAKPMVVTLPFVLLLLDWWPLGRFQMLNHGSQTAQYGEAPQWGEESRPITLRLIIEKIPFVVLSVIVSIITMRSASRVILPLTQLSMSNRIVLALLSYLRYVEKMVWPENLVVVYPTESHFLTQEVMLAGLFLIVVSVVAIRLCKARPFWMVGWFWYLGILFPVIGLVQVGAQAMGDHYTYLPSIGIFILVCWEACDIATGWANGRAILAAVAAAVLAACLLTSHRQLQSWRNPVTLFEHNLEVTPGNYVARADFAAFLRDSLQLEQARQQCEIAIGQAPNFAWPHQVLGGVYYLEGKFTEADVELDKAMKFDPGRLDVHMALATVALARNAPGEAAAQYDIVLAAEPVNPQAHCGLGQALAAQGKLTEAEEQLAEASREAPRYPEVHFQLGVLAGMKHDPAEAIRQYREALALQPDRADALNNLAWILATDSHPENRDGIEAVKLSTRACQATHEQQPVPLGTFAAACAETGSFDDAIAAAQKAHDLALAQGNQALAARNLELLAVYRSHHAFHEK